jgi:ABC-2 type transport system permease protein
MHAFVYTLSILFAIAAPIVFAVLLRRRFRAPWLLFAAGSLTFIGSQVVHFPLNDLLTHLAILPEAAAQKENVWRTALVLGLTAGLCEELARAVGFYFLKRFRRFKHGFMAGLGHGGIEAMILIGVLSAGSVAQLFALRNTDLTTLGFSAEQLTYLSGQMELFSQSPLLGFTMLFERLVAMTLHVSLSMLVLYAFQNKKWIFIGIAVLYHALVDMIAVAAAMTISNMLWVELILVACAIPGIVFVVWRWREEGRNTMVPRVPVEWGLFWQSLRKEWIQLWRTKMVLVIVGVFALFGIMSPLLAHFMPEIFSSIEGAEMFKDLIPQPSVADATGQYLKNISQFGFLIAILVGMGKVASEKEKGMTEMILHKPLPRWAYILSKFTAQVVVYTIAFIVAQGFAFAYTWYLFGEISLLGFSVMNALLLVWLLCFVAVTTLGSTVAKSIGAAAGISLGGAVVLMLTAQIPKYGAISPQALIGWAGLIGKDLTLSLQTSNFTALGAAVVFIVMCMVWAVGLFEQQEI